MVLPLEGLGTYHIFVFLTNMILKPIPLSEILVKIKHCNCVEKNESTDYLKTIKITLVYTCSMKS